MDRFLGFNLLLKLIKIKGLKITSVSRKVPKYIKKLKKVKFIKADFSNYNNLTRSLSNKKFDIIINLGGNIDHKNKLQTEKSHFNLCKNLVNFFQKEKNFIICTSGQQLRIRKKKVP